MPKVALTSKSQKCYVIITTNLFSYRTNVRLGEYDISNSGPDCVEVEGGGMDCTSGAMIVPIEEIIPHPNYDPNNRLRRNDIALIRLNQMVPYTGKRERIK